MGTPIPITCNGTTFESIKALSAHYGLAKEKVTRRLAFGWSPEQAVELMEKRKTSSTGKPLAFDGVQYQSLADASKALGYDPKTIAGRIAKGYTPEDALRGNLKGRLPHRSKPIEFLGEVFLSQEKLAEQYGLPWRTVWKRLQRGWTMEQALGIEDAPPRFRNFEGHAREHKWKEVRVASGKVEPVPDAQGYKLYLVTNSMNDKVYVGLTIGSLENRLKQHFAAARRGRKSAFTNAIQKHGESVFKIELIKSDARTYDELQEQEVNEIVKRDSIHNGYNTAQGGSIGSSKAITIAGKIYQSFAGAAEAHGVDPVVFGLRVSRLKWTPEQAVGLMERNWTGKAQELTVNGKTFKSLSKAATTFGQKTATVRSRLHLKGWTVEQSLGISLPPVQVHRSAKPVNVNGTDYTSIAEASKVLGVSVDAMRRFIRLGATADEAYTKCTG